MEYENICLHCKMDKRIRNPSGYCDHLHYPENCTACSLIKTVSEINTSLEKNYSKEFIRLCNDEIKRNKNMDYDEKIKDIEELTKIITGNKQTDKVLDLIYKKCEELKEMLSHYYIE